MAHARFKNSPPMLHFMIITASLIGGGIAAILLGKDLGWDLANYHYYNPFAYLKQRHQLDYWPTSYLHQFLNPTLDFLTYFLINTCPPILTVFITGAIHGINLWLVFIIARFFMPGQIALPIFLAILGLYGPTALPGLGSFQQDLLISIFILVSIFFQVKTWRLYSQENVLKKWWLLAAGFFLGFGAGLKLTALLFIIGVLLTLWVIPIPLRIRLRASIITLVSVALGLSITSGHWMLALWQSHGNPFFPFFNHIFQSRDFEIINWLDKRFLPRSLMETLFYPFYFSWDGRTADFRFQDFRFMIIYVLLLLSLGAYLFKNKKSYSLEIKWLIIFLITSYFCWQHYFSISRYLITLEILAPLYIYLLIDHLILGKKIRILVMGVILSLLPLLMLPHALVRALWYEGDYFNVRLPASISKIKNATVLTAFSAYGMEMNPRPQLYLVPFFPPEWHFIGVPFQQGHHQADQTTHRIIQQKLMTANRIFLLTSELNMPALYDAAKDYGLIAFGDCEKIISDRQLITHQQTLLCPVSRT